MPKYISNYIKSVLLTDKKIEDFLSQILIPLWILTLYFLSFSKLLPAGVNNVFVTRSGKYALEVGTILSLPFIAILVKRKRNISFLKKSNKKLSVDNLILLLLPLTPITQYIINNLDILTPSEAVYVFFIFSVFTAVFVLFIPALFNRVGSSQMLMFIGLAFTFSIINMGNLSQQFGWYEVGTLRKQLVVFIMVFLICWLFFYSKNQKLLYTLIIVLFLTTAVTQSLEKKRETSKVTLSENSNDLLNLVGSKKPKITPNIYLLIYDAYVVNETMVLYGIDNQPQEQYLEELGFQIYPHTYSIGQQSVESMSRVLNASMDFFGGPRRATAGDGMVQNILQTFGYKTYGIFPSDYFFQGSKSTYDYSFPNYTPKTKYILAEAISTGEFRFDIGFDDISREQFVYKKIDSLSQKINFPKFIYTHSTQPGHSQNSGICRPNEVDLYKERLIFANLEMKRDLKIILGNDPDAIIIVAGDHGPYLTKNCHYTMDYYDLTEISRLDIQDRYGTFLAIKWPTQDFYQYDNITVLQDLFPSIFAYIFEDQSFLKAKIEPVTIRNFSISNAKVVNGIIEGGIHNGEPLFIARNDR